MKLNKEALIVKEKTMSEINEKWLAASNPKDEELPKKPDNLNPTSTKKIIKS